MKMIMTRFTQLLLAGAGVLGAVGGAHAATNLLGNPAFNAVGPQGASTSLAVPGNGTSTPGYSAAADWTTWVTPGGTVATQLVPSDLVAGGHMLHVKITSGAGLVQNFITQADEQQGKRGPELAYACVWIKLVAGGATSGSATTATPVPSFPCSSRATPGSGSRSATASRRRPS